MKHRIFPLISALPLALGAALWASPLTAADPPFYHDKFDLLQYIDTAGKRHPVRTQADWENRRCHIVANMELVMGPAPREAKPPLDVKIISEVDFQDVVRRKISYQAKKNDRVRAYLFIPKNREGKRPAMVVPHPTSIKFGKGIPAGVGGRPRRATALELAERGYVTIAPDYVYMGEPQTDPYELGYVSGAMKGVYNHMRAVDLLQAMPEVDPARFVPGLGHPEPRVPYPLSFGMVRARKPWPSREAAAGCQPWVQAKPQPRVSSHNCRTPANQSFEKRAT